MQLVRLASLGPGHQDWFLGPGRKAEEDEGLNSQWLLGFLFRSWLRATSYHLDRESCGELQRVAELTWFSAICEASALCVADLGAAMLVQRRDDHFMHAGDAGCRLVMYVG